MTDSGAASGGEPNTSAPTTRRYTSGDVRAVCELLDLDPEQVTEVLISPWEVTVSREFAVQPGRPGINRVTTTYSVDRWLDPDA